VIDRLTALVKANVGVDSDGVFMTYVDNDAVDKGVLNVSLEKRAQELRRIYGTCMASYILHDVDKLSYGAIARLLSVTIGTVKQCVHRHRIRSILEGQSEEDSMKDVVPIGTPTSHNFREVCRNPLSMECQMLESEAFMYAVARDALPTTAFWDVFIFAKAAHRVVFPDIYNFLVEIANTGTDMIKMRKLLRAVKVKDRWYVGDGIVAYVYSLLDKSCLIRGYGNTRFTFNILAIVERMTRKDPTEEPSVYLTMLVSDKLAWLIKRRKNEIIHTQREVHAAITRMYDLD
jgi:hypothetical protein